MMPWQGWLYVAAVLVPLAAFVVEFLGMRRLKQLNARIATLAIATSFVLSCVGFVSFLAANPGMLSGHEAESPSAAERGPEHPASVTPVAFRGTFEWVVLGGRLDAEGKIPGLSIPLGIHIDALAAIMFVMVSFISTLIHVYSIGYMKPEEHPRFFAFLSLFCFSMLGLVASATIFQVFVFWELVGICSYLLIGFWYREKANVDAANKAFVVNRVGDVGMLVGLGILWSALGTFDIQEINHGLRDDAGRLNVAFDATGQTVAELRSRESGTALLDAMTGRPHRIPLWMLTVAGLGVFAGCVGKSAQFPLHVWLPDAMAGPTPVSALIHAATMVAAGVYLVGRFFPLFTEDVLLYIAYTGGITLNIGASIALVQTDYKKVLAYSTVSQLGFMMLGLGVAGWAAGLFHLLTHACFKALLFLGAGSVYHAVHTYEMTSLGGLRRKMPTTATTMLIGTAAISGFPFLSGFYSKDAILGHAFHFASNHPDKLHWLLFAIPVLGATLTAFYMFRMWFLVFDGEPRGASNHHATEVSHGGAAGHHVGPVDHAHESPPIMTWPLVLLAIPTVCIGWPVTVLPFFGFEPLLENMLSYDAPHRAIDLAGSKWWAMGASMLIFCVGTALALGFYSRWRLLDPALGVRVAGPVYRFLVRKWYFDDLYRAVFVRPTLALGRFLARLDRVVIDGFVDGSARLTAGLSRVEGAFDRVVVDGLVNMFGLFVQVVGELGTLIQTGRIRHYLMVLAVGSVVLFLGLLRWLQG